MTTEAKGETKSLIRRTAVLGQPFVKAFDTNAPFESRAKAAGIATVETGAILGATALGIDEIVVRGAGMFVSGADMVMGAAQTAMGVAAVDAALPTLGVLGLATLVGRHWEKEHTARGRLTGTTSAQETREGHQVTGRFLATGCVVVGGAAAMLAAAMAGAPDVGLSNFGGLPHGLLTTAEVFGGIGGVSAAYAGFWSHRVSVAARPQRVLGE